ncbi:hypothetical protein RUMGNA_01999 [Mediterraneibacter gnavus ATCC 29149]|uniref:Uncharacterized protein n=1 Tax=Mediterraneibacter gnavus (strain ATCC 29149 / DSM 114966 / JCM 6515 / VPI C7-9) TaxID=411470 RepID=A7B371_MEDG7|nr:hypothetical protein RUMGNA_01999 [Mediterraneibacter gnavus ATCC 29149]
MIAENVTVRINHQPKNKKMSGPFRSALLFGNILIPCYQKTKTGGMSCTE